MTSRNSRKLEVRLASDARQYDRGFQQAQRSTQKFDKQLDHASKNGVGRMNSSLDVGQQRLKGFNSRLQGMTGLLAGGLIGAQVLNQVKAAIDAASDLQESMNAVNVVFGEAADGIHAIGETSAQSFGLSQATFNDFAVRFSAFAEQIAEKDGRSVVDIVDEMTTRVADFASVHNLSMERAAEVAQSTLAGETEAFRRFGGDVSAATVNAHAFETGIAQVGSELTEQEKILSRYSLFMEQTADTAGDFANTSDDVANQQRILRAEMEDTRAELGNDLLPLYNELLGVARDVAPALADMATGFTESASAAVPLLQTLGPMVDLLTDANALLSGESGFGLGEDFFSFNIGGEGFDQLQILGDFLKGPLGFFGRGLEKGEEFFRLMDNGPGRIRGFSTGLENHNDVLRRATSGYEQMGDNVGSADDAMLNMARRTAPQAIEAVEDLEGEFETATPDARDLAIAIAAVNDALRVAADPAFAAVDAIQGYRDALADLDEAQKDPESSAEDLAEAELDVAQAALDAQAALSELGAGNVEGAVSAIADALGVSYGHAQDLLETLGILNGQEVEMVFSISMPAADRALLNAAQRGGAGGFTSPGSNTSGGDIQFRQHGGRYRPGPRVVGERGPELDFPDTGGFIANNQQFMAAMERGSSSVSSSSVTQNITIPSSGDPFVDAQRAGYQASVLRRMETG